VTAVPYVSSPPSPLARDNAQVDYFNPVDGDEVPVPHYGLQCPSYELWKEIVDRVEAAGIPFIIKPTLRFKGMPGEQVRTTRTKAESNAVLRVCATLSRARVATVRVAVDVLLQGPVRQQSRIQAHGPSRAPVREV
jgi:hypothetical protein